MRGAFRLLLGSLLMALGLSLAHGADSGTGTVVGTVIDDSAGRYLEGAEVRVAGTAIRTTTQRGGRFSLSGVPAGSQTLTIYYPDLETETLVVQVSSGQITTLETVRLAASSDVIELSEFTVQTSREGMSQAIALQKASFNQKLVAAGEQFGDISEGNVGEYLKFLPGVGIDYTANDARAISLRGLNPNFTNVAVDGGPMASGSSSSDSRTFELEQVAINNVETIEIFKTMTPDMPADSTGGQVNLVTKSAFDREARQTFSYNLSLTANNDNLAWSMRGAWGNERQMLVRPNADLNYSLRATDRVGLNFSYRLSEITHDYPRTEYSWDYRTAQNASLENPFVRQFRLRDEQKITHRQSFATKVDYKLSEQTRLVLSGQWNWYDLVFMGRQIDFQTNNTPVAGSFTPNSVTSRPGQGNINTNVGQRNTIGIRRSI